MEAVLQGDVAGTFPAALDGVAKVTMSAEDAAGMYAGRPVTIQRWPVLERKVDEDGKVVRSPDGYIRTKNPLEERQVRLVEFPGPSRVTVHFILGDFRNFSLRSGRGVRMPDWVLSKESLKELRKLAKEIFPKMHQAGYCAACEHHHSGPELANICVGCPCPRRGPFKREVDDAVVRAIDGKPANDLAAMPDGDAPESEAEHEIEEP